MIVLNYAWICLLGVFALNILNSSITYVYLMGNIIKEVTKEKQKIYYNDINGQRWKVWHIDKFF